MYFVAVATDYDETAAQNGRIDADTVAALETIAGSGRKLILVTGRELPDLQSMCDQLELFDLVVAENGALLYDPATREETVLCDPPPADLVARLREAGVTPLSVGHAIVATRQPNETIVLEAIRDLGLGHAIVFNKGAVMALPADVNKASGLERALDRLKLSAHNVVGVGDAENDIPFLSMCGCAVAVANALPSVKAKADLVLSDHGQGLVELAAILTGTDMAEVKLKAAHGWPSLGTDASEADVLLGPTETLLVAGGSGAGKSTLVSALVEQMREEGFQFCIIDPEGDYDELDGAVVIGDAKREPIINACIDVLERPEADLVVNMLSIRLADRPAFLAKLLAALSEIRATTGRPHWLVLDEAHHYLPAGWEPAALTLPQELPATVAVTVEPATVAAEFLNLVTTVVGVGPEGPKAVAEFRTVTGTPAPGAFDGAIERGQGLVLASDGTLTEITLSRPKEKQKRHLRKYAQGDLGQDRSFYFRGREGRLKLKAQNLAMFQQIAAGVDEETWQFHLEEGDYSRWFEEMIKDPDLAAEVRKIEAGRSLPAERSRERVLDLIDERYTAPAKS